VRQVPLRLPAWTWAAAAALVLGVVTPLTMVTLWSTREEPLPVPRPEALAPPTVALSPLADARGDKDKEEMKPGTADELKLRRAAAGGGPYAPQQGQTQEQGQAVTPPARLQSKSAREKDGAGGLREEVARSGEAGADSPESGYQRLLVAPAQTVAGLRARREA